jgi:hydroxylaminobenzene mutase
MDLSVPVRHPLDPDPVRSTKASVVLALGIVAAATGFLVGGLIPATLALVLARQATAELAAAGGYLTGRRSLNVGVALAWVGICLAAAALVLAAIIGLLHMAQTSGRDYAPGVN